MGTLGEKEFRSEFAALVGEDAPIIATLIPELAPYLQIEKVEHPAGDHYQNALSDLIIRISRNTPILFHIENAQWIDKSSLSVISHLSKKIHHASICMILCVQSPSSTLFPTNHRIELKSLSENETKIFVSRWLNGDMEDPNFLRQIYSQTEGNPRSIAAYLESLIENGCVYPYWKTWKTNYDRLAKVNLPSDMISLTMGRLNILPDQARDLLSTAAVFGRPFDIAFLVGTSTLEKADIAFAISAAFDAKVIELCEGGYQFVHGQIVDALVKAMQPDAIFESHLKIATFIEAKGTFQTDELCAVANHYLRSDRLMPLEKALEACTRAGYRVFDENSLEQCIEYLSHAKALSEKLKLPLNYRLESTLGKSYHRTGHLDLGMDSLEGALACASDSFTRAATQVEIIRILWERRQTTLFWEVYDKCFLELGLRPPSKSVWSLVPTLGLFFLTLILFAIRFPRTSRNYERNEILYHLMETGVLFTYLGYSSFFKTFQRTVDMAYIVQRMGPSKERVRLFTLVSTILAFLNQKRLSQYITKLSIDISFQIGDKVGYARALSLKSIAINYFGDSPTAEKLGLEVIQKYRNWVPLMEYATVSSDLIWNQTLRGYTKNALENAEQTVLALQVRDKDSNRVVNPLVHCHMISLLAVQGKSSECAFFIRLVEDALTRGKDNEFLLMSFSWSSGFI